MTRTWTIALAALALSGPAWAGLADDDLAVVKKAVASAEDDRKAVTPPAKASPAPARKTDKPQWLRVRVTEKGAKKAKVSINLPLALARALGDDVPFDWHCRHHDDSRDRCSMRLSEVLAALESGEDLVQVDDDEATVRVWVE